MKVITVTLALVALVAVVDPSMAQQRDHSQDSCTVPWQQFTKNHLPMIKALEKARE